MAIRLGYRLSSLILVCCAGAMLAGCGQLGAMSRTDPATIATYPGGSHAGREATSPETRINARNGCGLVRGPYDYHIGAINLACFRFPEDWPEESTTDRELMLHAADHAMREMRNAEAARARTAAAVATRREAARLRAAQRPAQAGTDAAAAEPAPPSVNPRSTPSLRPLLAYARAATNRVDRNRLTAILFKHSDDVCTIEMGLITANQATVNASLNIVGTGATTVANIVTGQAQEILTAIGTFAGASRSHISADVYRNTFTYALSRAIDIERNKQREAIESRYPEEVESFPIDDAIRAANLYHSQCSFYKGLELILASVEAGATIDRSLRERERQLQILALEEESRRLLRDIDGRKRDDSTATELYRRLDAANQARAQLVLTPISTTAPITTAPTTTTTTGTTTTTQPSSETQQEE